MKLFVAPRAPNPRRVLMFIAEKGIADRFELVDVDLNAGEHRAEAFRARSPLSKVPALELDDGRVLSESRAICTWLEGLAPEPNLMGRDFDERDTADGLQVVIVNSTLARHQFPDGALGKRISNDGGQTWNTIVGVVGDARQYGLDRVPAEEMYYPLRQGAPLAASLLVRANGPPTAIFGQIRDAIRGVDPRQPVAQVKTLDEARSATLSTPRAWAASWP